MKHLLITALTAWFALYAQAKDKNGSSEPKAPTHEGTCILDSDANPKRMTIKSMKGPNRGKTFPAIYEMKDGDSLRICYDLSGKEFPKEFKAPKGTQLYLVDYRRQKEKQTPPK